MNNEIIEILRDLEFASGVFDYTITPDRCTFLKNYITKLHEELKTTQEKIEYNTLVLKALHRYLTEHECYETHEFLRQLETCTENDMMWLKRMAGDNNELHK